ncbi:hypothetical protein AM122 [Anaplasma marginale str. St. Maries]|nr:hypothetical protein AM122 [Anaplasma marginale str. St. Maries]
MWPHVCGITLTTNSPLPEEFTVIETPSSATEPLRAMYFVSVSSQLTIRVWEPAIWTTDSTLPTPSTCPCTICPSIGSPILNGNSRFTLVPALQCFRLVAPKVSLETFTVKPLPLSITVKQTPAQATEPPTAILARRSLSSTLKRTATSLSPGGNTSSTTPTAATIPLNIKPPAYQEPTLHSRRDASRVEQRRAVYHVLVSTQGALVNLTINWLKLVGEVGAHLRLLPGAPRWINCRLHCVSQG